MADKKIDVDIKKGYTPPPPPAKPDKEGAGYTPPPSPKKPKPQPRENKR